MSALLEPLRPVGHDDVLDLNERFVHLLAPLSRERLVRMTETGTVEVIRHEGGFVGFVVTAASGSDFESENFDWFGERYDSYCYLDRIVLHEHVRRIGLGRGVYDEIEERAAGVAPLLALEVNCDPPNDASLAFHAGRGFVPVGERELDGHTVRMLVKHLAR